MWGSSVLRTDVYERHCRSGHQWDSVCGLQLVRTRRAINAGRSRRGRDPRGGHRPRQQGRDANEPSELRRRSERVRRPRRVSRVQRRPRDLPDREPAGSLQHSAGVPGDGRNLHRVRRRRRRVQPPRPLTDSNHSFSAAKIHRTRSRPFSTTPQADSSCAVTG